MTAHFPRIAALLAAALWLTACVSPPAVPSAEAPATQTAAATELDVDGKPKPKWDVATEKEVADALDREFEKAAKGFVKLKKDGVLMFCKRYRMIGSSIRTLQCITEAELRTQVQDMNKYRDDMRQRSGRCTHGVGCTSGS
jgi:hypothetical protein